MKMKKIDTLNPGNKFFLSITAALTLLFILVGCSFPTASESLDSELVNETSSTQTQINFNLTLPHSLNENEKVVLEIIDEVTGVPYHIRQVDMNGVDDLAFTTSLTVPTHSVIKYRYAKIGDAIYPETTLNGDSVRYRMVYADANHTITDALQAWQNEPLGSVRSGTLEGTILDRDTNLPISDILVSAGGQLTFSDANGQFNIDSLPPGVHNLVFYAMDGHYRTYQQGAVISEGLVTPADVKMTALPPVTVTLNVTAPDDALGAPIRIAGNLAQLGNTFASLEGDMSLVAKRMPTLSPQSDGTLRIDLHLYAESDLRFKFTLGDGYWNAESGGSRVRQLIVPDQDITLDLEIESWRSAGVEPITFQVTIPPGTSPEDEKYIQFKATEWTEPLPLWPLGNGRYLYILYAPLNDSEPIEYRFCRNMDCQRGRSSGSENTPLQVLPSATAQTISTTLSGWENFQPLQDVDPVVETFIPEKSDSFSAMLELSTEMDPSWRIYAPVGISKIVEMGAESIIFTPRWFYTDTSPRLNPIIGKTPYHFELLDMLNTSQSIGLNVSLFPQFGSLENQEAIWPENTLTKEDWQTWFDSYHSFIINYAKIAQQSGASELIIGGKPVLPAFLGGLNPDGSETTVPETSEAFWLALIDELRETYNGRLIWGTNAHESIDPLPEFIDEFDGIYISISSPLTPVEQPSLDDIKAGFTNVIDSLIYEIYRSTLKPVTVGLAYPSVDSAARGCQILDQGCRGDGLFRLAEMDTYPTDLEEQALIYNAALPVLASREWVTGISITGYDPTLVSLDGSSSIAGKPAEDVIRYWFTGLTSE